MFLGLGYSNLFVYEGTYTNVYSLLRELEPNYCSFWPRIYATLSDIDSIPYIFYSAFQPVIPHIQMLWELVLTGEVSTLALRTACLEDF